MNTTTLIEARKRLLKISVDYFVRDPAVLGIFLGGSLPAGTADAYSDIDMRIVVAPEEHERFVQARRDIPRQWDGFLFNEWIPGAKHCVSHFRPFCKIDIFYISLSEFGPTPWYTLPIELLYDPQGVVGEAITRSKGLEFIIPEDEIDFSISKCLASAHEAYRRIKRGELFFAQTLLDAVRHFMIQADDWIHHRPPQAVTFSRLELRASRPLIKAFEDSYKRLDETAIEKALMGLVAAYREQIILLHRQFRLTRSLENDLFATDIILNNP